MEIFLEQAVFLDEVYFEMLPLKKNILGAFSGNGFVGEKLLWDNLSLSNFLGAAFAFPNYVT